VTISLTEIKNASETTPDHQSLVKIRELEAEVSRLAKALAEVSTTPELPS
jgi:hypothetical protein